MRKATWRFTVVLVILSLAVFARSGAQTQPSQSTDRAQTASYTVFATDLAGPRGLVFGRSGELYVAEQSGGSVAKIGSDGRTARIAKGFSHPHDLAIDAQGYLYLADSGANRIARISPSGEVTTYIDNVQFPVDLDPQGELLICELYRGRVVAFKGPQMVRVIASGLSWPHGLAFGKQGEIFINENTGNRINKLTPGKPMEPFAEVQRPVGLAFGPSGDLYVAQPQVGKVSRIKPDGTVTTLLQGLKEPRDPAFDHSGNLYVAETEARRILKLTGAF
jgi:glucose/arabinose dehydrogenase